jgi:predicted phosphohydrolase
MGLKSAAVRIRQSRKRSLCAEEQQIVMAVHFPPVVSSAGVTTVNVCVQDLKN